MGENDGKAERSAGFRSHEDFSPRLEAQPPWPSAALGSARGLWWLVALCESPHLEITLEGTPDLLGGSSGILEGIGPWLHQPACSAHTGHYGMRKWLLALT